MEKELTGIPRFDGKGLVTIENFIKIFERRTEARKDERPELIFNFLDDTALNYATEQDLDCETWEKAKTKLQNYFTKKRTITMQDFLKIKLEDVADIDEYFRRMTDAAKLLDVKGRMLIELLINGLSHEMKTLNITREFADENEFIQYNRPIFYHLKDSRKDNRRTVPRTDERGNDRHPYRAERHPPPWQQHHNTSRWTRYPAVAANYQQYAQPRQRGWSTPAYQDPRPWRPPYNPPVRYPYYQGPQ